MCMICVDFQRERMTIQDARRAYSEMVVEMEPEHAREVKKMIEKAEKEKAAAKSAKP